MIFAHAVGVKSARGSCRAARAVGKPRAPVFFNNKDDVGQVSNREGGEAGKTRSEQQSTLVSICNLRNAKLRPQ
jgi:hypothetical protein